ncbi:MAG: exo-alpha-sialidase [Deltaproteobacteria bacterium]|nr:exo-alpha-sialidase [Deltaproteobacteria bacterium]
MSKRFITILGIMTLLAYAWPAWTRFSTEPMTSASFSPLPRFELTANHTPFMDQDFINPSSGSGTVHVGSICEMPDGQLGAIWYGGTREGAKDVAIFFSKKPQGIDTPWSAPRIIVDRASATRELNRYIRKVGNPVLFSGPGKHLYMIYVTITVGGWSGSSLNVKTSRDGGHTWANSRRLTLSPFFNISELVKGRPLSVHMAGGHYNGHHFAVPIYHEFLGYFPEILWIAFPPKKQDILYEKSRMAGGTSFIQPSIAPFNTHSAAAFYRCRSKAGHIAMARTDDGGQSWSSPRFLDLPNPDSAVDALPLTKGRILLAFNDSRNNRETLQLAVSNDSGLNWVRIHTLENLPDQEFSYPYMIGGQNGLIHLVYTWKRKRIKHVVFNEAWVDQKLERATKK